MLPKKDDCVFSPREGRGVVFSAFFIFHFIHFFFPSVLQFRGKEKKKKTLRLERNREILRVGFLRDVLLNKKKRKNTMAHSPLTGTRSNRQQKHLQ